MRTPMDVLTSVRESGFTLRVRRGQLVGPRGLPEELREEVKEKKWFLVNLLMTDCPISGCGWPLEERIIDDIRYAHCSADPAHFALSASMKRE